MQSCGRCGSDRLFQFLATPASSKRAVNDAELPLVCRSCGQITVNGSALQFPEAFEAQAKDMAEAAAQSGRAATEALTSDPNAKVTAYFAKVYREAYLDGFLRCLAFYQHNLKEGRLKRLRELWSKRSFPASESICRLHGGLVYLTPPALAEFDSLMMLGPVPD